MRKFISKVTVTGADDSVNIINLIEIAEEFPFVEFGILLSGSTSRRPRFPSSEWVSKLIEQCFGRSMNFSGHLCGTLVQKFFKGKWPFDESCPHLHFASPGIFRRWQLNTHAMEHEYSPKAVSQLLKSLEENDQTAIFQYDEVNTHIINSVQKQGHKNIAALFDLSHGAGILPHRWPHPITGIECGYAGGLSPKNVADQLSKLERVARDGAIWIDAETRLRTPDDSIFDLSMVKDFLQAAAPWVSAAAPDNSPALPIRATVSPKSRKTLK